MTVIDQSTVKYYPFYWTTSDRSKPILQINRDSSIEVDWVELEKYCDENPIYEPLEIVGNSFAVTCMGHALLAMKNGKVTNLNAAN